MNDNEHVFDFVNGSGSYLLGATEYLEAVASRQWQCLGDVPTGMSVLIVSGDHRGSIFTKARTSQIGGHAIVSRHQLADGTKATGLFCLPCTTACEIVAWSPKGEEA